MTDKLSERPSMSTEKADLSITQNMRGRSVTPRLNPPQQPLVVAFGGGTNSLAVLIGLKRREIVPDLITFSDTKGEKPETYEAVDRASEWCLRNGFPAVTPVRTVSPVHGFEGFRGYGESAGDTSK